MGQFTVHRNVDRGTALTFPYLLDVQDPLLSSLSTRVVIPLEPTELHDNSFLAILTPEVTLPDGKYRLLTPEIASVPTDRLGRVAADLSAEARVISQAIELLFKGL
jgi:toxin CcdB